MSAHKKSKPGWGYREWQDSHVLVGAREACSLWGTDFWEEIWVKWPNIFISHSLPSTTHSCPPEKWPAVLWPAHSSSLLLFTCTHISFISTSCWKANSKYHLRNWFPNTDVISLASDSQGYTNHAFIYSLLQQVFSEHLRSTLPHIMVSHVPLFSFTFHLLPTLLNCKLIEDRYLCSFISFLEPITKAGI